MFRYGSNGRIHPRYLAWDDDVRIVSSRGTTVDQPTYHKRLYHNWLFQTVAISPVFVWQSKGTSGTLGWYANVLETADALAAAGRVLLSSHAVANETADSIAIAATTQQGSAHFDGTGNNYFKVTAPATATYPFWVAVQVQSASFITFGNVINIFSIERTGIAATNGFGADIYKKCPRIFAGDGTNTRTGISDRAALSTPYADSWTFEFLSATDRRIYLNGVRQDVLAPDEASCTPDLSAGSPELRIGHRGTTATEPFKGNIQHVVMGSGSLSSPDRTLYATAGANYSTMTGAAHWWPLQSDGLDRLGSSHFTMVGTVTFDQGDLLGISQAISPPTAAQYCQQIFKQSSLPTDTCTVTAGGSPPVTVSTNLAGVEYLDGSFVGTDTSVGSPYTFRVWHYEPTVKASPRHAVLVNGGHETPSDASLYHMDTLVNQLVANGYDVYHSYLPGYDPQNPGDVSSSHDSMISRLSSSVNPLEKFLINFVMVINTVQSSFTKISITGLSGGAWLAPHQAAIDARINHAIVPVRGTIADRYLTGSGQDFEQWPEPNYWKQEHIYYAAARGDRRLWLIHAPTDNTVAAKTKSGDHGSYLDATNYDTDILAPIRTTYSRADILFHEDANDGGHFYSDDSITQVLAALSTPLSQSASAALIETADISSIAARVKISGTLADNEGPDSASIGARVRLLVSLGLIEADDRFVGHVLGTDIGAIDPEYLFVTPRRIRTITPRVRV